MEILSVLVVPLAIVIAAMIGARIYKREKVYDRKETFYLGFLKDLLDIISYLRNLDANSESPATNDEKVQKKMKEFLNKHGPKMTIYATPRFKRAFEKSFRTTKNTSGNSYTPLVMMSVLIEEAKKELHNRSSSIDEIIGNLAIYTSTNDVRNEEEFILELKIAHGLATKSEITAHKASALSATESQTPKTEIKQLSTEPKK